MEEKKKNEKRCYSFIVPLYFVFTLVLFISIKAYMMGDLLYNYNSINNNNKQANNRAHSATTNKIDDDHKEIVLYIYSLYHTLHITKFTY